MATPTPILTPTQIPALAPADAFEISNRISDRTAEILQRITTLEGDIKRHEVVAVVVVAIFGLSLLKLYSWFKRRLKKRIEKELKGAREELNQLIDSARAYIGILQQRDAGAPGVQDYEIQFGQVDASFPSTNYTAAEITFPTPFASVPNVFVGEGSAGAWLVVKVDEKSATKFKWAANNLLGASSYRFVVQWVAIAKRPTKTDI